MRKTQDLSPKNIERLTEMHISRYSSRIIKAMSNSAMRTIRIEECQRYLDIWKSIKSKQYVFEELTTKERIELFDAIDDERGTTD
jgi:4-hydroxy-3-methylbut-2-en-1-yl diphosphate synthase IspG/GcpE